MSYTGKLSKENLSLYPTSQNALNYQSPPLYMEEICQHVFLHALHSGISLEAFAQTSRFHHRILTPLLKQVDLKKTCPSGLTILDAETLRIKVDDEPQLNHRATLYSFSDFGHLAEKKAGAALLTLPKGLNIDQLIEVAKNAKMTINFFGIDQVVEDLRKESIQQTHRILITNNVVDGTRTLAYLTQDSYLKERGCEMPEAMEYIALAVFTYAIFKKCIYADNAWTYGRSSTRVLNYFLAIGCSADSPDSVILWIYCGYPHANDRFGAGGRKVIKGSQEPRT